MREERTSDEELGGHGLGINDYFSLRAEVVATGAHRVVQQQGHLGFEESRRRDFVKLGGQAILKR